jgi:small-conductance mechanosensitive channel
MEPWLKSRQWLITVGLLILALAAGIGFVFTRDLGPLPSSATPGTATEQIPLVDERPLQTARAMAKVVSGADERRFADQAAELADNEVDLAFHDALRDAANHPVAQTAQNRELYQHASESEAQVKADQDHLDQLKKELASAKGAHQESVQEQLDVAQAQLELDQDEADDAKEDLIRSGADPGSLIQRQFDQHQASEHGSDAKTAAAAVNNPEVNYQAGSLWAQFSAWRALRSRALPLHQARDEARQTAAELTQKHAALDKRVKTAKAKSRENPLVPGQPSSGQPSLGRSGSGQSSGGVSSAQSNSAQSSSGQPASQVSSTTAPAPTAVTTLHRLSDDQKNLADLDKRIQDEQELANSYAGWIAVIHSHQRAAMHGMTQSALLIILILLVVYLTDRWIDRYLAEMGEERTRLHTLRAVIRFAVQAIGVVLILLVIIGAPQQTTTFLGLATAGITVAMKDFIVAFFGWFVLMGKNGLRVGDWVEINGVAGEVIEINLLRTVLLETGNWTDTGHPTGRKVAFVNSYAIEGHFFNFTTSGQWMWDELQMTVPPNQDPYPLLDAIQGAVTKETESNAAAAEKEWQNAASNYKVRTVSAAPTVNLRPTSAGVEVHVRYISRAKERSALRARLNQALVELLHHRGAESMSAAK